MTNCPELDAFAAPTADVDAHLLDCTACRIVAELVALRRATTEARDERANCERYEDLMAARAAGPVSTTAIGLIDAHVATCAACRAVANTMAPVTDLHGDHTSLPAVSTAAYALGREVARGGMGRIVAARDLRIGRDVAVKELLASGAAFASRFEREARITARLQHPGIVPIYEIGTWPDGTPFYAMRMVEGKTLGAAIAATTSLAERLALLPSVIAAAEAVAFAHAHSVIHRDLTPSNVMVGEFGETVVIDWGLAKDLSGEVADDAVLEAGTFRASASGEGLTAIGAVIGTAAYMSPEQAHGETVDRRSDVYALGALLYQLLVGAAPYRGKSLEILELVKDGPPTAIDKAVPDAPRDLISIAQKAMARGPAWRYQDARELADELVRFQAGRIVEAHRYSRGELLRRWIRRHRAAVIGAGAALVALVVAGSIGLTGVLRERDRADDEASEAIAARSIADAQKVKANGIAISLLEEQGRHELLASHNTRALAYLDSAMQQGLDTPALRFMLARALPSIEGGRQTYTCDGHVQALVTSENGSRLVAACGDVVRAWDLATQREVFTVAIPNTTGAVVSPDGKRVLVVGERTVLVDAVGAIQRELGRNSINAGFTPDGGRAIVTYGDATARVWDLTTGAVIRSIGSRSPVGPATRGAVSADGNSVALASDSGHVALFDVATGKTIAAYEHGSQVAMLDIADDGHTLVTCGTNSRAVVWRANARPQTIEAHSAAVIVCALSRDGAHVVLSGKDRRSDLWDVHTGRLIVSFASEIVRHAVFSRDGRMFVTSEAGLEGEFVRTWGADSGALLVTFDLVTMTRPGPLAFAPDGSLVFGADGSLITAWTTRTPRRLSFVAPDDQAVVGGTPEGNRVLTRAADGRLTLWDVTNGLRLGHAKLQAHTHPEIDNWSFSRDGLRLAAWNGAGLISVIDTRIGTTLGTAPATAPHDEPPWVFLDDRGARMLILDDGVPRIWDVDRAVEVMRFPEGSHAAGISPDGHRVLVWTKPTDVDVWDLDRKRSIATLHPDGEFYVLGYDESGTRVVLSEQPGNYTGQICTLYDVETGHRIRRHSAETVNFDPQRRRIILSDAAGARTEIWNVADGQTVEAFTTSITNSVPNSDGNVLASSDGSKLMISSGTDGRLLATLDTSLIRTDILPGGWTYTSALPPRWLPGTHAVVVLNGQSAVWDLPLESRTTDELHRVISAHIPWHVVDGKLVALHGRIEGKVIHAPANTLVIAKQLPRNIPHEAPAEIDGTFMFDDLPLGAYVLSAGGRPVTANVAGIETVHVDLSAQ